MASLTERFRNVPFAGDLAEGLDRLTTNVPDILSDYGDAFDEAGIGGVLREVLGAAPTEEASRNFEVGLARALGSEEEARQIWEQHQKDRQQEQQLIPSNREFLSGLLARPSEGSARLLGDEPQDLSNEDFIQNILTRSDEALSGGSLGRGESSTPKFTVRGNTPADFEFASTEPGSNVRGFSKSERPIATLAKERDATRQRRIQRNDDAYQAILKIATTSEESQDTRAKMVTDAQKTLSQGNEKNSLLEQLEAAVFQETGSYEAVTRVESEVADRIQLLLDAKLIKDTPEAKMQAIKDIIAEIGSGQ